MLYVTFLLRIDSRTDLPSCTLETQERREVKHQDVQSRRYQRFHEEGAEDLRQPHGSGKVPDLALVASPTEATHETWYYALNYYTQTLLTV
jgi:hypothetical protein